MSSSETIEAIAAASGFSNSAVGSAAYTINLPAAAMPTFSPAAGTYTSVQSVTISDSTSGATVYYTTDGTTPTTSSAKYNGAITVSSSETIQAIATATGYSNSAVGSATYAINLPAVVTITTNANGNITSIPPAGSTSNASFTYNNANRLASVTGSPLAATFVYDWEGKRSSKTNPGAAGPIIYSYGRDGKLLSENDNGVVTDYIYVDGRPIAVLHPGAAPSATQVSYIVADRLGTPQLASNSSGPTVWSTTYQPFGTTGNVGATITQNLRLPGQYADAETGFNYNLYRDYMPGIGRYLEKDPFARRDPLSHVIESSLAVNQYEFVLSNPLRYKDPTGLFLEWINSGIDAAASYQTGQEWKSNYEAEIECAEDTASGCTLSDQQVNDTSNEQVQALNSLQAAGSEAASGAYSGTDVMGSGPGADAFDDWGYLEIQQTVQDLIALPGRIIELFTPKANAEAKPNTFACTALN